MRALLAVESAFASGLWRSSARPVKVQGQSDTANALVHFIAFDKVAFNDNTAHLGRISATS